MNFSQNIQIAQTFEPSSQIYNAAISIYKSTKPLKPHPQSPRKDNFHKYTFLSCLPHAL